MTDRDVDARIAQEDAYDGWQVDHRLYKMARYSGCRWIVERSVCRDGGQIRSPFLDPMGRDLPYPECACEDQRENYSQCLKSALTIEAASQQEIKPHQAGVLGLDREADG